MRTPSALFANYCTHLISDIVRKLVQGVTGMSMFRPLFLHLFFSFTSSLMVAVYVEMPTRPLYCQWRTPLFLA